jgi:mono/diheme cytochrome c family protein
MRRTPLVVLSVVAWLACSAEEPAPPPKKSPSPAKATAPAPPAAAPAAAPAKPVAADAAAGRALYQLYCASCHGTGGAGDGPVAAGLDPKPARHDDGTYMNALSNEQLFQVIQDGGASVGKSPLMAPWGATLSDAQIGDVIAFVRSLADPPYPGARP